MAISVLQRGSALDTSGAVGSVSFAFGSNNTAGSAIIVVLMGSDSTSQLFNIEFANITDTRNTYVKIFDKFNSVYQVGMKMFVAYNVGAGANTVTCSTDTNNATAIYVYEVAGLATSSAFDLIKSQNFYSAVTAYDSTSTLNATTNANELLIGAFVEGLSGTPAWTLGAGYSNLLSNNNTNGITSATEEQIVAASATRSATATTSVSNGGMAVIATFSDTAVTQPARATHIGTTFDTTSGTHTLAAGVLAGDLIVIVRTATGNITSTAPTDNNAGGAGTYVLAASALTNTSADLMEFWVRTALVVTSSSTTFSEAPGVTTGGGLCVYRISGMSRTGASAVKQTAVQANHASGSAPAPVFGAAVTTTNIVISAVDNITSSLPITATSTYQADNFSKYSTPTSGLSTMHRDTGETGTTITWGSSSSTAYASIAIELDTSAAAAGQIGKDMTNLNNTYGAVIYQARTRGSNY